VTDLEHERDSTDVTFNYPVYNIVKAESVKPIMKARKMEHRFGRNVYLRKYKIG
jgi:hypothetical protein